MTVLDIALTNARALGSSAVTFVGGASCLTTLDDDTSYAEVTNSTGNFDGVQGDVDTSPLVGVTLTSVGFVIRSKSLNGDTASVQGSTQNAANTTTYAYDSSGALDLTVAGSYLTTMADPAATVDLASCQAALGTVWNCWFDAAPTSALTLDWRVTYAAVRFTYRGSPPLRHKNRDDGLANSMARKGPKGPTSSQGSARRGPRAYS